MTVRPQLSSLLPRSPEKPDIREFTPESWRDRIGVVFQDPILFSGTVHENIAYGSPDVTREDVEEAARKANCDFIWNLPKGFDTVSAYDYAWVIARLC
jgi:ABC-type multidrug transport system fused ATPase/permease subunit